MTDITQEREGWVDCVYLDLKKAFDKVPHNKLLWKLENTGGVNGNLRSWMESYLTGRERKKNGKIGEKKIRKEEISISFPYKKCSGVLPVSDYDSNQHFLT